MHFDLVDRCRRPVQYVNLVAKQLLLERLNNGSMALNDAQALGPPYTPTSTMSRNDEHKGNSSLSGGKGIFHRAPLFNSSLVL